MPNLNQLREDLKWKYDELDKLGRAKMRVDKHVRETPAAKVRRVLWRQHAENLDERISDASTAIYEIESEISAKIEKSVAKSFIPPEVAPYADQETWEKKTNSVHSGIYHKHGREVADRMRKEGTVDKLAAEALIKQGQKQHLEERAERLRKQEETKHEEQGGHDDETVDDETVDDETIDDEYIDEEDAEMDDE